MNCLEFRRLKLEDPRRADAALREHLDACPQCAAFSAEVDTLEAEIREAVQVPVPEGLAERVLLRRRGGSTAWLRRLAVAAVLVIGMGLGLVYHQEHAGQALARQMIEHVLSEPEVYTTRGEVPPARVMQALATVGARPRDSIGEVTFLDNCKGLDPGGTHLLVYTAFGRAAVLLLPNLEHRRPASLTEQGLSAALLPAPRGLVVVVAESPDIAARVQGHLQRMLRLEI
jgi:hypothetical protein